VEASTDHLQEVAAVVAPEVVALQEAALAPAD
jgi:hypothetical protein